MAQIQVSEVVQGLIEALRLDAARDVMPNRLGDIVVPTFDYSNARFCEIVRGANRATTGATTIFTTPSDRDFFLSSANLAVQADISADSTGNVLQVTVGGVVRDIIRLNKISLTVTTESLSTSYPIPLKIDRNTGITIAHTFTVGASTLSGCITGFTIRTDRK